MNGYSKYKRYILTSSGYKLCSHWTSSNTVHFDDGKTAQTKVGAIDGITDSLTSTSSNVALSAKSGKSLQDQVTQLNTHLQAIGSWEDITGSCNLGYVPDSWGNVYKNIKLRMVVFYIGANSVNNQSPILGIGQLPGDATVKVIGIASCSTSGVSVDIKNDRYIVRSSHSQDGPILDPRYLGIALF